MPDNTLVPANTEDEFWTVIEDFALQPSAIHYGPGKLASQQLADQKAQDLLKRGQGKKFYVLRAVAVVEAPPVPVIPLRPVEKTVEANVEESCEDLDHLVHASPGD